MAKNDKTLDAEAAINRLSGAWKYLTSKITEVDAALHFGPDAVEAVRADLHRWIDEWVKAKIDANSVLLALAKHQSAAAATGEGSA